MLRSKKVVLLDCSNAKLVAHTLGFELMPMSVHQHESQLKHLISTPILNRFSTSSQFEAIHAVDIVEEESQRRAFVHHTFLSLSFFLSEKWGRGRDKGGREGTDNRFSLERMFFPPSFSCTSHVESETHHGRRKHARTRSRNLSPSHALTWHTHFFLFTHIDIRAPFYVHTLTHALTYTHTHQHTHTHMHTHPHTQTDSMCKPQTQCLKSTRAFSLMYQIQLLHFVMLMSSLLPMLLLLLLLLSMQC